MATKLLIISCLLLVLQGAFSQNLKEGDACTVRGKRGTCQKYISCAAAKADLSNGIQPQKCKSGLPIVVCCAEEATTVTVDSSACPAISNEYLKIRKDGRGKSRDKCIDWLDLIYRCTDGTTFPGVKPPKIRKDECNHAGAKFIIGGEPAKVNEFPHQAALGYIPQPNQVIWDCGGTLISDQWVLTAGHCIWSKIGGDVAKVKLGTVNVNNTNPDNIYDVVQIVKYPTYIGTSVYDDIALLKLDRKVKFSQSVIPACLDYEGIDPSIAVATGWGLTEQGELESRSKILMKVTLDRFTIDECMRSHPPATRIKTGVKSESQICFGGRTASKDTCAGDSGGPLQIFNQNVYCTYIVVGVTSFGKGCGEVRLPGVYTRVNHYINWIEGIVWP